MRVSAVLLVVSVAGVVGGAWLIGLWAVGAVIVVMSAGLGVFAVLRDTPDASPSVASLRESRRRARDRAQAAA